VVECETEDLVHRKLAAKAAINVYRALMEERPDSE
jgi:hypothetical protein